MAKKEYLGEGASSGLSRRGFLKGAGLVGAAAVASAAIPGCAPGESSGGSSEGSSDAVEPSSTTPGTDIPFNIIGGESDDKVAPGMRATPNLDNARPIPPEPEPEEWTAEADIVVVGTGGAGLAASLLSIDMGSTVITVEKESSTGGCSQHACGLRDSAGTAREQIEMGYSTPSFPYDRNTYLRWLEPNYQYTADVDLLGNVVETAGEAIDWMQDKGADLACNGGGFTTKAFASGEWHKALSFKEITDKFYQFCLDAGVEFYLSTACETLITNDEGRVIGIKAKNANGEMYFKANKGVVFCAGGMGMNPDLLKVYIPSAYYNSVMGGPMPYHTGECIRMGLGVGADICGRDSWCSWESEMDNDTGNWVYFWGARQVTQLPWMSIDIRGKRCCFYEWDEFRSGDSVFYQSELPAYSAGQDRAVMQIQGSRINHRAYCIFDGKFEDYMWDICNPPMNERRPTTKDDPIKETMGLFDPDWHVEFQHALDDGRMKKADTLEELAEMLGLEADVLQKAVDDWNECCETGVDTGVIYPLPKRFLNPIVEPPFYGAKIGPRIGKTHCGLRVDDQLRVVNDRGKAIPGLYAAFTTAGGITGESTYGCSLVNSSLLGGNGLSWCTGYFAAKTANNDAK